MARKKREEAGFDPNGWMLTFSDLVTLLLTFFVMLLSMKQPEITKLKAAFGVFSGGTAGTLSLTDQGKVERVEKLLESLRQPTVKELLDPMQRLAEMLDLPGAQETKLSASLQKGLIFRNDPRGLVITLANDLIFPPGMTDLSDDAKKVLNRVAPMLKYSTQPLSIEGHTDALSPAAKGSIVDNWSLSLARAQSVRRYLEDVLKVRPSRMRVAALGDTRPLAGNNTPEGRARNRRTEIIILMSNY